MLLSEVADRERPLPELGLLGDRLREGLRSRAAFCPWRRLRSLREPRTIVPDD